MLCHKLYIMIMYAGFFFLFMKSMAETLASVERIQYTCMHGAGRNNICIMLENYWLCPSLPAHSSSHQPSQLIPPHGKVVLGQLIEHLPPFPLVAGTRGSKVILKSFPPHFNDITRLSSNLLTSLFVTVFFHTLVGLVELSKYYTTRCSQGCPFYQIMFVWRNLLLVYDLVHTPL